jgi:hypothetical protein
MRILRGRSSIMKAHKEQARMLAMLCQWHSNAESPLQTLHTSDNLEKNKILLGIIVFKFNHQRHGYCSRGWWPKEAYPGDGLQIHIVVQLHVLGVDAQHLQATSLIGHTDVDLAIEAPEAPQCSVDTACSMRVSALVQNCADMHVLGLCSASQCIGCAATGGHRQIPNLSCGIPRELQHGSAKCLLEECSGKRSCLRRELTMCAIAAEEGPMDTPVGPVGGTHDNDVRAGLEAVHERQQLRHNAPLHLSLQAHAQVRSPMHNQSTPPHAHMGGFHGGIALAAEYRGLSIATHCGSQ